MQDVGLARAADSQVLDWAARDGRIVLTHDVRTMIGAAYARVRAGQPMPGMFVARQGLPIGLVIEDLLLLTLCSLENEWDSQILYLPL